MEQLPLRDASIAFVFSWPRSSSTAPGTVFAEIERVLRPGERHCSRRHGTAVRGPRRSRVRPYASLKPGAKIRKALIPSVMPCYGARCSRFAPRDARTARTVRTPSFAYHRLTPNLHEYVGTDCDAFTSMDPHAAILYFGGRGWDVPSHPTARPACWSGTARSGAKAGLIGVGRIGRIGQIGRKGCPIRLILLYVLFVLLLLPIRATCTRLLVARCSSTQKTSPPTAPCAQTGRPRRRRIGDLHDGAAMPSRETARANLGPLRGLLQARP